MNVTSTTLDLPETIRLAAKNRTPDELRTIAHSLLAVADVIERAALKESGRRAWVIEWPKRYSEHDRFFLGLQQSTTLGDILFINPATPENATWCGVGRKWADPDAEFAHEILALVEVISTSHNSDGQKVALVAEVA